MGALAQDGAINEEVLSMSEIDRMYDPLKGQVSDSCSRQESILGEVQVCASIFKSPEPTESRLVKTITV